LIKLSKDIEDQVSKFNAVVADDKDDDDDNMVLSTTESGENREISDGTVHQMKKSEILFLCEKRDKDRVDLARKMDELLTAIEQEDDLICKIQYAKVFDNSITLELLNSYSEMRECLSEMKCEVNKNLALLPKLELKEQLRKEIKEKFIEPHRILQEKEIKLNEQEGNIICQYPTKKGRTYKKAMKQLKVNMEKLQISQRELEMVGRTLMQKFCSSGFPELQLELLKQRKLT